MNSRTSRITASAGATSVIWDCAAGNQAAWRGREADPAAPRYRREADVGFPDVKAYRHSLASAHGRLGMVRYRAPTGRPRLHRLESVLNSSVPDADEAIDCQFFLAMAHWQLATKTKPKRRTIRRCSGWTSSQPHVKDESEAPPLHAREPAKLLGIGGTEQGEGGGKTPPMPPSGASVAFCWRRSSPATTRRPQVSGSGESCDRKASRGQDTAPNTDE